MYFNINDGRTSLARGKSSDYDDVSNFKYLKFGTVVSIDDEFSLGRIKVRINGTAAVGGDKNTSNADLPYAYPMLPKHLQVTPKVGEAVWVFVFDKNRQHTDRLYIGPVTSQLDKLNYDDGKLSAFRGFSFGAMLPNTNIENIPQLIGIFPNKEDISIQGRYNTDITQKSNEIVLRAGKFESTPITDKNPYPFTFNAKTQSFIQMKNDVLLNRSKDGESTEKGTITNIVANKINLITHKDGSPRFNVTDQNSLITDDEMFRILEEAHQLPFGDVLIEYLKLLKEALFAHVHNGNGNPATDLTASGNKQALATFKSRAEDLEKSMLSKNIRIN
jgi:hypothetical protein